MSGAVITLSEEALTRKFKLAQALATCDSLKFVNFTNLKFRTEQTMGEPLTDTMCADLLKSLGASHKTLIEILFAATPHLGNAGIQSAPVILDHVSTMPHLISFDFSRQRLSNEAVLSIVEAVMASAKVKFAKMDGIQSSDWVENDPSCQCCEPLCAGNWWLNHLCWMRFCFRPESEVYDKPSPMVLAELSDKTMENRGANWPTAITTVVTNMLRAYRDSLDVNTSQAISEIEKLEQDRRDKVRHEEEAKHRREIELAAAGAGKTLIATTNDIAPPIPARKPILLELEDSA